MLDNLVHFIFRDRTGGRIRSKVIKTHLKKVWISLFVFARRVIKIPWTSGLALAVKRLRVLHDLQMSKRRWNTREFEILLKPIPLTSYG